MAVMEVTSIDCPPLDPALAGRSIDLPHRKGLEEAAGMAVEGWVAGKDEPVVAVEILQSGQVLRRVPVDHYRADVVAFLGDVGRTERTGFAGTVAIAPKTEPRLVLEAVLASQRRVPLGSIELRPGWRRVAAAEENLVSVIIPTYNHARFLGEAIESAARQTWSRVEIVVIDDGSTDNTPEVVARYPAVRYFRTDQVGVSAARNEGIRRSNGQFLIFLDADDRLLPRAAELGVEKFRENPPAAFVSGEHLYIDAGGGQLKTWMREIPQSDHYARLLRGNYIGPPNSVIFRREALSRVGGFDPAVTPCEDYDLYLRVAREFAVISHGEPVAEYRRHGSNSSRGGARMLRAALAVLEKQKRLVRSDPELREAVREGQRFYRNYYGHELQQQLAVSDVPLLRSLAELLLLARHRPAAALAVLRSRV